MKALKVISLILVGLMAVLSLCLDFFQNVEWRGILVSVVLTGVDIALMVLLLISIFNHKPILGYIAVAIKVTMVVCSTVLRIVLLSPYGGLDASIYVSWILSDVLSLLPWVLALLAPKKKGLAIITMALMTAMGMICIIVSCVNGVYALDHWGTLATSVLMGSVLNGFSQVCRFHSIALAALWLVLQKKKASPEAAEEVICEGVE